MKKTYFTLIILLFAGIIYGNDYRSALQYTRNAQPDDKALKTFSAISFDPDLYDHTNDGYTDLRLYDRLGRQLPFALQPEFISVMDKAEKTCIAQIDALSKPDSEKENSIELIISRPQTLSPSIFKTERIIIATPATNFEKMVTVYGSNDQQNWQLLVSENRIYDYSSIVNLRNTAINISPSDFRWFKLQILNFSEVKKQPYFEQLVKSGNDGNNTATNNFYQRQDFRIDRITLAAKIAARRVSIPAQHNVPVTIENISNKNGKQIIELRTSRSPIVTFIVNTSSRNFARECILEYSKDGNDWYKVDSTKIYSFALQEVNRTEMSLKSRSTRAPHYRITIINNDNPPLENVSISALAEGLQIMLMNENVEFPVTLYYDGTNIPQPQYDIREVMKQQRKTEHSVLTMSAAEKNPLFKAKIMPNVKWFTIAMYTVLGLAAAVLIITLTFCLRKFDAQSSED